MISDSLPVTELQRYMIEQLTHPECTYRWAHYMVLTEGLRVKPPISERKLGRALKKLAKRHDVLRLVHLREGDEWRARIGPVELVELIVEDHGDVTEEEMRRIAAAIPDDIMPVDGPRLCEFRLLRFGALGDVVVIRLHHSIIDGFGLMVIVEDLVRILSGLPFLGGGLAYADYLADVDRRVPPLEGRVRAYWENLLFPAPPPVPLGSGAGRGAYETQPGRIDRLHDEMLEMPTEEYEALKKDASAAGASFYALACCALADALGDMTGADDIIGRTNMSRNSGTLSNYAGAELNFAYFRTRRTDGATLLERAAALRAQLIETDGKRSRDFGHPLGEIEARIRAEAGGVGPQIFVHLGTAEGRAKASILSALFQSEGGATFNLGPLEIERMSYPRIAAMALPCEIAVYVLPSARIVRLLVRCNGDLYPQEQVREIAERFRAKLASVQG